MDRRRINGPVTTTTPPVFAEDLGATLQRTRPPQSLRKLYLRTGVTPSASGSAYLEIEPGQSRGGMKLTCTVHGPRALPRSAPFSPYLVLSTHVKYAPFASRLRRGYLRDTGERDLSAHLETSLRGVILAERWPKSGVDVIVTIVEGDQLRHDSRAEGTEEWDMMNVLAACITVASAAIIDAGIDCVDVVAGGVAAGVSSPGLDGPQVVLDPALSEHDEILSACCVAYLPSRVESTNIWVKGELPAGDLTFYSMLVSKAAEAAVKAQAVIKHSLDDSRD